MRNEPPHADDCALLNDLCEAAGTRRIETKAFGAPENKVGRRGPYDHDAGLQRDAIVAIGKSVLEQGRKIDAMVANRGLTHKTTHGLTHRTWSAFQDANDRRLAEIKRRGSADPLRDLEIARMNAELDVLGAASRRISLLEAKRNRPPGMGSHLNARATGRGGYKSAAELHHRAAVIHYMKTGSEIYDGTHLRDLQRKAMHSELNPAGGYLLLPETARSPLATFLNELSRMRQRATVRTITREVWEQPTRTGGAEAGWVGEREERQETATPTLGLDSTPVFELYAEPRITQVLLDNVDLDTEAWLTGEIGEAFSLQESDAWFNGDGMKKPRGLLTYPFVAPGSWVHGKFRYIATGSSGAFPASNPADKTLDLVHALKSTQRIGASWLMNTSTIGAIRKFKDDQGQYLWQPSTQAGQPAMLHNFPVDEDEFMPDIGADTFSVGFGNWQKTYQIIDRKGVFVIRDNVTLKGWVKFYTTKRVGGSVQHFDAAAFLKFGTS